MPDNRQDDEFELRKKPSRFNGSFVMLYGCEITDKRVSSGAKMLKHWLEFRCGGNYKNNFVSKKALARDFGVSKNTIKRWMEELESIGALEVYIRSDGKEIKIIKSIEEIYGESFVSSFRELISDKNNIPYLQHSGHLTNEDGSPIKGIDAGGENIDVGKLTDDQKYHLGVKNRPHEDSENEDGGVNNRPQVGSLIGTVAGSQTDPRGVNNRPGCDLFVTDSPCQNSDISIENHSINGVEKKPEVEELSRLKVEEIISRKNEIEERIPSHSSEIPDGISTSLPGSSVSLDQVGDSHNTPTSEIRIPEDPPVDDDAIVRRNDVISAMNQADNKEVTAREKRSAKFYGVSQEERARRRADKEKSHGEQNIKRPWTWTKLEKEVWCKLFQDHYPGMQRSSWKKRPEGELAERLLKDYGDEIVRESFVKLYEQWHFIKKKTFPYSKDPEKWVIPDFMFFSRPEAQQFMAGIKIVKPKIVNRINPVTTTDNKKSGLW